METIVPRGAKAGLVIAGLLLGACATPARVVAARFSYEYNCPGLDLELKPLNDAHTDYEVTGCGYTRRYSCFHPIVLDSDASSPWVESDCKPVKPQTTTTYRATDGSTYVETREEDPTAMHQAALASAAHDLPCALSSVALLAHTDNIVDGCGQRVTYQMLGPDLPKVSSDNQLTQFRQFVLVGRVAQVPQ